MATGYTAQDILDVADKDDVRVAQTSVLFAVHQFKDYMGSINACVLEWEGRSNLAPSSSTAYLQIYNRTTEEWETIDSDNSSSANTDFVLTASVADLSDYKDGNTVISCRIYQEAL